MMRVSLSTRISQGQRGKHAFVWVRFERTTQIAKTLNKQTTLPHWGLLAQNLLRFCVIGEMSIVFLFNLVREEKAKPWTK